VAAGLPYEVLALEDLERVPLDHGEDSNLGGIRDDPGFP
jgi:hypothetical protein